MNFVLAALILDLLGSTVIWAAKIDRPQRRETDEDDGVVLISKKKCFYQFNRVCHSNLKKYDQPYIQGESPYITSIRNVNNAGARAVCGDIRSVQECMSETLDTNLDCLRTPQDVKRHLMENFELLSAVNSICIQHLSAIEQHWDCLINYNIIEDLGHCGRRNFSVPCDSYEPQIECSVKVIESSPSCGAGAGQFIQEFQKKYLPAIYRCSGL